MHHIAPFFKKFGGGACYKTNILESTPPYNSYSTRYSNNILRMTSYFELYIMYFIKIIIYVMFLAKLCRYMYDAKY